MKNHIILLFLTVTALQLVKSKIFEDCELAEELQRQGFASLRDWVCLIEVHSKKDTSYYMEDTFGYGQWGIFQINEQYWCRRGSPGGECKIACEALMLEDITDSAKCASKIWDIYGFGAWQGWTELCRNPNNLPNLTDCNL